MKVRILPVSSFRKRPSSPDTRRVVPFLFFGFWALLLVYTVFTRYTREENVTLHGPVYDVKDVAGSLSPPQMLSEKSENAERTVFLLPGKENRCMYQYDYVCKFWFYIRCYVYAAFPNVEMLSLGVDAVSEFKDRAKDGDIGLVIWRSKNHSTVPEGLLELLQWRRQTTELNRRTPRVRVGVFHIANEKNRSDWLWYTLPDFVIRNYWIPDMPAHVTYIPLGPQLPNQCTPRSTEDSMETPKYSSTCDCHNLQYKRASKRLYLWNFSGSLRKKRAELLRRLRKSHKLQSRGFVQVAKKFGGDGVFGSLTQNPKNGYLDSILESQFVFAPCGNAMETHRIYEALALGAIPVIENCDRDASYFFPFDELLIDGGPAEMISFVEQYVDLPHETDVLQRRVMSWWSKYAELISKNVSRTAQHHVPATWRQAP